MWVGHSCSRGWKLTSTRSVYDIAWSIMVHYMHGRPQKFFQGVTSKFCLSFSVYWRCNANGRLQNALPFPHHKENVPLYSGGAWRCIRALTLPKECTFCHLLQLLLNRRIIQYRCQCELQHSWVGAGLELSTSTFVVLTLVCTGWTSLLNLLSEMFSSLRLSSEMLFLFINCLIFVFFEHFPQISHNFRIINGQNNSERTRKLDPLAKLFQAMRSRPLGYTDFEQLTKVKTRLALLGFFSFSELD